MPVEMNDADHAGLDATINRILRAYSEGACDAGEARAALAHMMCAIAIGNEQEFIRWCTPGPVERWLKTTEAARSAEAFALLAGRTPDHPTPQ